MQQASKSAFSFESFQNLCSRLQSLTETNVEKTRDSVEEQMIEVIRQIAEALIWGEQTGYEPNFFDHFCERNVLEYFVRILGMDRVPKGVKVQIVQTLSMLVQNISRDTSLYYLFSNNHVNHLISTEFDWNEEELLTYYISFLKSLALRLNTETIQFFFHKRSGQLQFPLYVEAIRFFGHRDQMVRTAIRNLTLQVYKVPDEKMQAFVLERSWRTYFVHLGCHLRELWFKLDSARDRTPPGDCRRTLQEVNEEQNDLLMYISDVLRHGRVELRDALADRILHYAIFPTLLGSLMWNVDVGDKGTTTPKRLPPESALFLLHQVLDVFRTQPCILNPLVAALLLHQPPPALAAACLRRAPPCPRTYQAATPDVSGPTAAQGEVPPLDDGAPADPGGQTYAQLAEGAFQGQGESIGIFDSVVRVRLLGQLESASDACVLLVASIIGLCIGLRSVLPDAFLRRSGLIRQACEDGSDDERQDAELLQPLLRALDRHVSLRVVSIHVLVEVVRRIATVAGADNAVACSDQAWASMRAALSSAARHVRSYLQVPSADWFLDVFEEEWQAQETPFDINQACLSVLCLMRPATITASLSGWTTDWASTVSSDIQHAAKALRCFLILRRLCQSFRQEELLDSDSSPPALSFVAGGGGAQLARASRSPLFVPEEVADGFEEQKPFEMGRLDRVVCAVADSGGQSHYLILHQFLLLLIKPDLVSAGWAIVRTMAPVRAVEPHIDAHDSQTLRLAIRLPRGLPGPGETSPYDPATCEDDGFLRKLADEHRSSILYTVTLKFMDNMRCTYACTHLTKRRQEVRGELRRRADKFVEGFC